MSWSRAKTFEVLSMGCSGLGSSMFTSVVPGDYVIQITFQVLCSLIILLRHKYGLEKVLYVNVSIQFICFRFGGEADLERFMFGNLGSSKPLYTQL